MAEEKNRLLKMISTVRRDRINDSYVKKKKKNYIIVRYIMTGTRIVI